VWLVPSRLLTWADRQPHETTRTQIMTTAPTSTVPTSFGAWTADLLARGFAVLPASHVVPVELWVRERTGEVLLLRARGTSVVLRRYAASDLTGLILRAECDCEEHRLAGAGQRTVLVPGARALAEVSFDGRAELGWSGVEAGLLDVPAAAMLFDELYGRLPEAAPGPWNVKARNHEWSRASRVLLNVLLLLLGVLGLHGDLGGRTGPVRGDQVRRTARQGP
jgi:hypothetical protein